MGPDPDPDRFHLLIDKNSGRDAAKPSLPSSVCISASMLGKGCLASRRCLSRSSSLTL